VLEPLAASESVLTDEDREYGCAVVNMGSEITSLMIFGRGAVQHTAVFPFGSMLFTKDIATGLRASIPDSNKIKQTYGCVASFLLTDDEREEIIEIQPFGREETRALSKEILGDILQPRAVELLQHVAREAARTKAQISGGVFLTGGGAMIRGFAEIAEQVFDAPTRVGSPLSKKFGGLGNEVSSPQWSVACGLALLSMKAQIRAELGGGRSTAGRVAEWIGNFRDRFR
jgi:cell division protein FtsA